MGNELKQETIRNALDARLSPLSASSRRRARIRAAAARKEKTAGKRKWSFALIVALLLMLVGAALAVGSHLFARFAQKDERYAGVLDQVVSVPVPVKRAISASAFGTVAVTRPMPSRCTSLRQYVFCPSK